MRLTLGHLLAHEALGVELVAGGDDAPDVLLAGAHPIEIEAPTRWLPPGWLMLTTGLRLRGRPDEQRRLVRELHEHGQAGLAWGIGLVVQQVPRAVVDEADRLGLPVASIPVHVPFRDVLAYVNGSLVSDELYVLRRVVSMQDYLMDALGAEDPAGAILGRMAVMLEAGVVQLGADGQSLAEHGRPGPAAVAEVVAAAAGAGEEGGTEAVLAGGRTLVAPVVRNGSRVGWVGVVPPDRPYADQLARPVLRSAARLLGLLKLLDLRHADRVRRRRAEALLSSLAGPGPEAALALAHDVRALGLDPTRPACGVVWEPADAPAEQRLGEIETVLERTGAAFLLVGTGQEIVGVIQGDAPEVAAAIAPGPPAGVGRAAGTLARVPASVADARAVLRHRARDGAAAVTFDELAPAAWLLARCEEDGGAERVSVLLAPLRSHPRLLETLQCFFEVDLDVSAAASRLGLHPNTLRYRLRRIEDVLAVRLASPETIAGVHVALLGERLAGR